MRTVDLIRRKRDGGRLDDDEIAELILAYSREEVPDYQMAALAMAVYFQGLDERELPAWTRAMLGSGDRLALDVPGPIVDKHSTGGVGDKTSLILAPICAALGLYVPMISGRGLGHTGGTLDKLESIPGFEVAISPGRLADIVKTCGMVICGQTGRIVPADRKLYALRDVTGTVDSIPLIASSIMSKKLAEGLDGLVLDVKVGDGAFMQTVDRAQLLAQTMVDIGKSMGVETRALLTNMDQPLGRAIGNAMEVRESIEVLKGAGPTDLVDLSCLLAAEMLCVAHSDLGNDEAMRQVRATLQDGRAWERFVKAVAAQGGDISVLENPTLLPTATKSATVTAQTAGYIAKMGCLEIGRVAVLLGAGRAKKEDDIDHAVGLELHAKIGDTVGVGDPLVTIHINRDDHIEEVTRRLVAAIHISTEEVDTPRLLFGRVD